MVIRYYTVIYKVTGRPLCCYTRSHTFQGTREITHPKSEYRKMLPGVPVSPTRLEVFNNSAEPVLK